MQLDSIIILFWHFYELRGSSQSGLVQVKDRNKATINDKEKAKKKRVLNQDTVAGKDIERKLKRFVIPCM